MLVLAVFLVTALFSFVSAEQTKLICLDNGETIRFSKCNSAIPDRTCDSAWGCQFCVTEKRSGVYCPQSINACNSQSLSCSQQQSNTESIETIPVIQNDEEDEDNTDTNTDSDTNSNNNQQNTQTNTNQTTQTNTNLNTDSNTETNSDTQDNSQQTNNENIFSKLINSLKSNNDNSNNNNVSVKGTLSAKTNLDKDNEGITGAAIGTGTNNDVITISIRKSSIFLFFFITTILEVIILAYLLKYSNNLKEQMQDVKTSRKNPKERAEEIKKLRDKIISSEKS